MCWASVFQPPAHLAEACQQRAVPSLSHTSAGFGLERWSRQVQNPGVGGKGFGMGAVEHGGLGSLATPG